MKLFYLKDCPHCIRARNWMNELYQENPQYKDIPIEWIEENENWDYANTFDYYYVPTLYDGDKKLHEGVWSKASIKEIFDDYLRRKQ